MRIRERLSLLLALLAISIFAGCQTTSTGGSSSGGGDDNPPADENLDPTDGEDDAEGGGDEQDTGNVNESPEDDSGDSDADDGEDDGDEEDPALSEEQEDAVETTVASISDLMQMFAALGAAQLPTSDDLPIVTNPNPTSDCPTMTLDMGMLMMDYANGCNPLLYPESTFSGSVTVQGNLAERTLLITFDEFTMDGDSVSGTAEAQITVEGDVVTLTSDVDLTVTGTDYEADLEGDVVVTIDLTTGEVVIVSADLTATDEVDGTWGVVMENVHSDPVNNVNFLPDSGTATIYLGTEGPAAIVMEIEFTDNTPVNGEVLVSVNGSPQISMSLDEVDVDP